MCENFFFCNVVMPFEDTKMSEFYYEKTILKNYLQQN